MTVVHADGIMFAAMVCKDITAGCIPIRSARSSYVFSITVAVEHSPFLDDSPTNAVDGCEILHQFIGGKHRKTSHCLQGTVSTMLKEMQDFATIRRM